MVDFGVGTGPTVIVEPSVVMVTTPVRRDEPGGIVMRIVDPSGSVNVSTVGVAVGPMVIVTPSVVIVSMTVGAGNVPLAPPGGTETEAPAGHHDGAGGHVGPGLPSVTVLAGEGARTAGPFSDSSFPLNAETLHS